MKTFAATSTLFVLSAMLILCSGCKPKPLQFNTTMDVPSNKMMTYKIEAKAVPSALVGTWSSKGSSANIRGATDDTLVDFRLLGPNNEVLQKLDHPTDGSFSIEITKPGIYTFEFNNEGVIRSSARKVTVQGTLTAK